MSTWTLTSGATAQTFAKWSFEQLKRTAKSAEIGRVTFVDKTAKVDDDPKLAYKAPVTIQQDGAPWFSGIVTKTPRMAGRSEAISYEISDPWWYFANTVFQQMWGTTTLAGGAYESITSARSRVINSQSLDGVKMDLGMVMREVIYYVLYAVAGEPFPTVVDPTTHIAAPPSAGGLPFTVGTLSPTMIIPYAEVTDKTCGELIKLCLRWIPDAVQWFDFSTVPPTLNICQRPALTAKTISLFGGTVLNPNRFNPTPRNDLLVPAVIAKYEQVVSIDGDSKDYITVDKFPLDAADNAVGALVATIDIQGGSSTYQHQDIVVQNLPVSATGTATLPWLKAHIPWLFGTVSKPSLYDIAGITCDTFYGFDIDSQDPFAMGEAPTGFVVANMNKELLSGGITKWLEDDQQIFGCFIVLSFRLRYTGSDATTLALFQNDAANPNTRIEYVKVTGTNADTMTYKQLTSAQQPEPVPEGLAEQLYNALSVLHWDGDIMFKAQECAGPLPIGCVFNTSDGRAEWGTMNAQVLSVEEDIDKGVTTVHFGHPMALGLQERTELLRAARGRVFSYKLDQRTSGDAGTANAVIGHTRTPLHHTSSAPGGASVIQVGPFTITYGPNPATPGQYRVKVDLNGIFLNTDGSAVTLTNAGVWFNLDGNDTLWLEGVVASYTCGSVAIKSYGNGDAGLTSPNAYWTMGGLTENDGNSPPNQTFFRKVLATFVASASGAPALATRQTTTNLQIINGFYVNESAIYPTPI
jgi:hypothetical protein